MLLCGERSGCNGAAALWQEAHLKTKRARGELAVAISAVRGSLLISRRLQRRAALDSMLSALQQLQHIERMRRSVL